MYDLITISIIVWLHSTIFRRSFYYAMSAGKADFAQQSTLLLIQHRHEVDAIVSLFCLHG